jgi:hypothetical protein
MNAPVEVKQIVFEAGRTLSPEAHDRIVAMGPDAVAPLLEILEDRELGRDGSPGDGYAQIHAAELLGELHPPQALEPMIRVLAEVVERDLMTERLIDALSSYGADLIEPALELIATSDNKELSRSLTYSLAKCGVEDERVYQILLRVLVADPQIGPGLLVDYGDPRALEHLARAFDEYIVGDGVSLLADHAVIELKSAIRELGGELTPAQQEKYDRATAPQRRFREELEAALGAVAEEPAPARPDSKPGRNDPCWCGSGRKYKKCHLRSDEDQT